MLRRRRRRLRGRLRPNNPCLRFETWGTRALPDQLDVVELELLVGGEDRQFLGKSLGDQQTVEGIAVVMRQRFKVEDVVITDGE